MVMGFLFLLVFAGALVSLVSLDNRPLIAMVVLTLIMSMFWLRKGIKKVPIRCIHEKESPPSQDSSQSQETEKNRNL